MEAVKVQFKRTNPNTPVPEKASDGAVAVDLVAVDAKINYEKGYIQYSTGLHIAVPPGYGAFLFPRSSISKTPHSLANSVGVIDWDYRGELLVRMRFNEYNCLENGDDIYKIGDRICQMVIMQVPEVEYEEVDELDDTNRGAGGFGSTGK